MKISRIFALICAFAFVAAISSCGKKNIKKTDASDDSTTATIPAIDIEDDTETFNTEANIRGTQFIEQENMQTIIFEFDKYSLSEKTRTALSANAEIIKTHKEWIVLVEGHCDNRGTTEYNLSLGQKRAKEVRDYYVRLGVSENSIGTISYGEENPACEEETEECWMKNRRSETKVRIQ